MELISRYESVDSRESERINAELILWLREYFGRRVNSRWIDERRCIPPHIVNDFARKGIFGFQVPQESSGLGLKAKDWVKLIAQLGSLDATISQLVAINGLAIRPYVAFGSAFLKDTVLPKLATGSFLSCFAQTEDQAGANFLAIESVARKCNGKDQWVLNGSKTWIGNAGWSNVITAVVHTHNENGENEGLTVFCIPTDAQGVQIGEELNTLGLRGVVQNRISFLDVKLTPEDVIGKVGEGMQVAVDAMSMTRLLISSQQLGLMKRCVLIMWNYTNRRFVSTGRLVENAVAVNFISECIGRIGVFEKLLIITAQRLDSGMTVSPELSSICKILSTEFAGLVSDMALQILGGRGYEENNIISQFVRDTRVTRIFEGPTEVLASFVGSRVNTGSVQKLLLEINSDNSVIRNISSAIESQVSEIKSTSVEYSLSGEQELQWMNYQKGLIVCWGALWAAYSSSKNREEDIEAWLEGGFTNAPRFITGNCILTKEYILSSIKEFERDIGQVDQKLPGLNWKLDEMISFDPK